ncbi:MAG: hypothetical protein ACOYM3_11200 [Terrimicrobiaceae bacterium]
MPPENESARTCVNWPSEESGKIAARLTVRAIPREKFDGIYAILKDC